MNTEAEVTYSQQMLGMLDRGHPCLAMLLVLTSFRLQQKSFNATWELGYAFMNQMSLKDD